MKPVRKESAGEGDKGRPLPILLEARHTDLSLKEEGDPEEVLDRLDTKGLRSMALTAGRPPRELLVLPSRMVEFGEVDPISPDEGDGDHYFVGLSFARSGGVTLHVDASDPRWVRSTFVELADELRRGLPWWRFFRHPAMWLSYAGFALGVVGFALHPTLGGRLSLYASVVAVSGVILGSGIMTLARRLLPGFEVLPTGKSGRGGRVLGFLGALALNAGISYLINLATK